MKSHQFRIQPVLRIVIACAVIFYCAARLYPQSQGNPPPPAQAVGARALQKQQNQPTGKGVPGIQKNEDLKNKKDQQTETVQPISDEDLYNQLTGKNKVVEGSDLLTHLQQGGPLMIFIVLLGLMALTIIIERLIFYTRKGVWFEKNFELFLYQAAKKSNARFREELEDELRGIFQIYSNSLERGLVFLTGIANIAPLLGFLGTVMGMITAFAAIAAAATVNAKIVASGIRVALITTEGGLIVAAPALFMYYLFSHIIQNRFERAEKIIDETAGKLPRLSEELCIELDLPPPPKAIKRTIQK